jgi:general secretion pathway protein D
VWLAVTLLGLAVAPAKAETGNAAAIYRQARKAEQHGHMAEAYLLYSQAAALAPENPIYWLRSQAVQGRAAIEAQVKPPASPSPQPAAAADAGKAFDALTDVRAPREPRPLPALRGSPGFKDFDLRADAKALFEQVASAFGLDTVFDGDYQPGRPIHFQVERADWRQTLTMLQAATDSFIVPISDRLFLVSKDTDPKRRQSEPTMAVTIPVPNAVATQELVEIAQAVRQLFLLEHVAWDSQRNIVVMRDRASRVIPARKVFEELLYHRPQVEIEIELLEVDRNKMLSYGVQLPTQFPLIYLGSIWGIPPSVPSAVAKAVSFGGGKSLFGVGVGDAELFASLTRSTGRTLLRADLRSVDGQPASFHIGQRYPILTSGYFGPASFSGGNGQQAYRPPPSFTFEDLGIVAKVTPHIHSDGEVTLDLETEFKVLAGSSLNGIPVISNRKLTAKVRLRDGEYGFVAGLLSATDARSIAGLAGVANLPVVGPFLRKTTDEHDTSEVLIMVKPHMLSLSPADSVNAPIRVGTDTRPFSPL